MHQVARTGNDDGRLPVSQRGKNADPVGGGGMFVWKLFKWDRVRRIPEHRLAVDREIGANQRSQFFGSVGAGSQDEDRVIVASGH